VHQGNPPVSSAAQHNQSATNDTQL
jgi:hypothetical protein